MASSNAAFDICEKLLDSGADINALDLNGKNALIVALGVPRDYLKKKEKESLTNLCEFLIEKGIEFLPITTFKEVEEYLMKEGILS